MIDDEFTGKVDEDWLKGVVEETLGAENVGPNAEVGLVITGQEEIRELNRDYRDKDEPTDVLSFAMLESPAPDESPFITAPDGVLHLGEVIISYPQAVIQAAECKHAVKKELALLIVHGVLHLLGYDHVEPEAGREMRAREAEILNLMEKEKL